MANFALSKQAYACLQVRFVVSPLPAKATVLREVWDGIYRMTNFAFSGAAYLRRPAISAVALLKRRKGNAVFGHHVGQT